MWSGNKLLARFQRLRELDFPFEYDLGDIISRGYADLGFEEFVVIGERKLLSLYNGKSSEIPEGHEKHFFRVLSVDELVTELIKRDIEVTSLQLNQHQEWQLCIGSDKTMSFEQASLQTTLLEALITILEKSHAKA